MIESRLNIQTIIKNANASNFSNCSYSVRIGKVFLPESGDEYDFQKHKSFPLGPSEVVLIETTESLEMPNNLYGFYTPLQSRANEGVMLVNGSLIEPAYKGKLSSYLVNISSKTIRLFPNDKIAKITFVQVDKSFNNAVGITVSDEDYSKNVSRNASEFHKTFVNLDGRDEAIAKRIKKNIIAGGIVFAIIALFSTLQGFFRSNIDLNRDILNSDLDKKVKLLIESNEKTLKAIQNDIDTLKKNNTKTP